MQRRIALKRLTASDLTLFEWQFRNRNAGNQKAINLNREIFVDTLYPSLPDAIDLNGRLPLDLNIYGPGHAPVHNVQRKILKGATYKNWRLDGEYINGPEDAPDRYNVLEPDDLAIFEFQGRVTPKSAKLILISRHMPADERVYTALLPLLARRGMVAISADQLRIVADTLTDDDHPFHELLLEVELEDAALGGVKGTTYLRRRHVRSVSREELQRAREAAEQVGRTGEELVFQYLARQMRDGAIADFRWEAEANAITPYDFVVTSSANEQFLIDVKATTGEFLRPIHISHAELAEMTGNRRYDLYRVFEASEEGGRLRIAENVGAFAASILANIGQIPAGVQIDSVSVDPSVLPFGDAVTFAESDDEDPPSLG